VVVRTAAECGELRFHEAKGRAVFLVIDPFDTYVSVFDDGTVGVGAQVGSAVGSADGGVIVAELSR
jgi:hypothetical protein